MFEIKYYYAINVFNDISELFAVRDGIKRKSQCYDVISPENTTQKLLKQKRMSLWQGRHCMRNLPKSCSHILPYPHNSLSFVQILSLCKSNIIIFFLIITDRSRATEAKKKKKTQVNTFKNVPQSWNYGAGLYWIRSLFLSCVGAFVLGFKVRLIPLT